MRNSASSWFYYKNVLEMLNKLQERVPPPHTHKRKTVTVIYVRKHPILEMQLNTVLNSIFETFICGIT